jgi:hypothetical protein
MIRTSATVLATVISIAVAGCAAETKFVPIELKHSKPERPPECRTREALPKLPEPVDGAVMTPQQWELAWLEAKAGQRRNAARDAVCQHYENLIEELGK